VLGAIAIVIAILVIPPLLVLMPGMIVAAILGHTSALDAEARYEGSELIELTK